jgi:nucleoside-diphosphate-sugar epimerase
MTFEPNGPRLLVTGANGFLGSALVRQAVRNGIQVQATDRACDSGLPGIEYVQADILDSNSLAPAITGVDTIIHTAGLAHVFDRAELDPKRFFAVNEQGTANVAYLAGLSAVRHLIVISSVAVYGDGTLMADEETICNPKGPYAESKLRAEQRAIAISERADDMRLTILRLATLYGEGDPGNVARLMRAIDRRRFIWIGDGSNRKSLLYRGDAVRAILTAVRFDPDGIEIYNVTAPPVTMHTVIAELAAALGRSLPPVHIPAPLAIIGSKLAARLMGKRGRFGSIDLTLKKWLADDVYDAGKIRDKLGFQTGVDLAEGLRREVAWYRGF